MDSTIFIAMSDELIKLAGPAERAVRDRLRESGSIAKKGWSHFKNSFNRRGPIGQAGIIGGIAGGVSGAAKGFAKNDPKINWETGEIQHPSTLTRIGRAAKGGAVGASSGAAMSAGTTYLVRKLTHA